MKKKSFSKIKEILNDAKKGKMFILVDDGDRENEGDLVIPGSKCNSKNINFMAKHGRGLICLALTSRKVKRLNLPLNKVAIELNKKIIDKKKINIIKLNNNDIIEVVHFIGGG